MRFEDEDPELALIVGIDTVSPKRKHTQKSWQLMQEDRAAKRLKAQERILRQEVAKRERAEAVVSAVRANHPKTIRGF